MALISFERDGLSRRFAGLLSVLVLALTHLAAQDYAYRNISAVQRATIGPKLVPGEILVRFRPGVTATQRQSVHTAVGAASFIESNLVSGLNRAHLRQGVNFSRSLREYRADPRVLYAEPNYIVHMLESPNDPQFSLQWNWQNTGQWGGIPGSDIHATQAWGISTGSPNVAVGVLDTGVDYTHPDLTANIWSASQAYSVITSSGSTVTCPPGSRGFNMVNQSCDPFDDHGHGTHVSGIIGAIGNNGIGVAGLNWQVQIIPCKWLDATGTGDVASAIACLGWMKSLKDSGVPIIATNNSWGGASTSQALADAIAAQAADGILFVAAAGNSFLDNDIEIVTPAGIFSSNLISVAATTNQDTLAAFSDVGAHSVHVGAPGQEILSTFPGNNYALMSGTSMAAPHVTGLAALLKAANPSLDWRSIRNLILTGGDPVPSLLDTVTSRRLNAYGSLTCSGASLQRRLQPTVDVLPATVGQQVNLAAINTDCGNAAGPVQVTAQPGGQTISLLDNGQPPDQTAGDGIYTGQFTPQAVNNYALTFPWGDTVQVEVLQNYVAGQTTYNYRNISGTSLNLGDDAVGTISAPFPVHFGGATFNTVYVSSNGTLSFTNKFDDFIPERIPVDYWSQNPNNNPAPAIYQPVVTLFAPWWQDLTPVPNTAHNVFWDVSGIAPNRELVIEWRDLPVFECAGDLTSTIRFQVVFSESSNDVISNYADTHFGGACASGDLGAEAEIGVQVSQTTGREWGMAEAYMLHANDSVDDGMALLWSIPAANAPPNPVPNVTSISPSTLMAGSGDTWVVLTGTGFTTSSLVEFYPGFVRPTVYVNSTTIQFLLTAADLTYPVYRVQVNAFNPAPGGGYSNPVYYSIQAPAAEITSISPTSVPAGSFGFALTIKGTGLLGAGDVMFYNGTTPAPYLQTTSVSATQITAIVPDSLLKTPGTVNIYLWNGSIKSNQVTFTITSTPGGIAAPPLIGSPGSISPVRSFNPPLQFLGWKEAAQRGGTYLQRFLRPRADLAPDVKPLPVSGVHPLAADASLSLSLPLPGLGFRPTLPADFLPTAVVTGDFNRDGHMDWAIANGGSNNIWIYLGNGDGTSQVPYIITLRGFAPVAMVEADMNGDGKLDLVVAEADSLAIAVLMGNGDGTFQPERITYLPGAPLSLAVADFDGDGNLDVVAGLVGGVEGSPLAFLRGDGKGNLALPTFHFGGGYWAETIAVAAADLNNDGLPDLVVVQVGLSMDGLNLSEQDPSVGAKVYLNAGNGSFKLLQVFDPDYTLDQIGGFGHAVTAVALGDVNHDGCIDAVAVDAMGLADYFPGLCNGSFDIANMQTIGTGVPGAAAALTDINRDGKLDLVVTGFHFNDNYRAGASTGDVVSVLLGNGDGTFQAPSIYRGEPAMFSFAVADLNGDGLPDIVTANQGSDSASVYLNDGTGGFGDPNGAYIGYLTGGIVHGTMNSPRTNFAFTDVNGDGHEDLLLFEWPLLAYQATNLAVMLGDGSGHYAPPLRSDVLYSQDTIQDFVLGDFRNTGRPDVLTLVYNGIVTPGWALAELRNNGDGTFQKAAYPVNNAGGLWPYAMVAGDFNEDGSLDVVVLSNAIAGVSMVPFFGHGDGAFTEGTPVSFSPSANIKNPVVGDFNQDGHLDLLLMENGSLYLIPGVGNGTFGPQQLLFANFGYFAAADLNGDGIPDLVEVVPTNPSSSAPAPLEYAVYLGQKGGSFQAAGTYGPYQGLFTSDYLSASPTDPMRAQMPFVADFNGDGKLDIAAYQTSISAQGTAYGFETGPGNTTLNFLLGNGDGTFTPSYLGYSMGRYLVPQLAVDNNSDQRADLIQLDAITSTYHVIHGSSGPSFKVALVSDPVIGTNGVIRIILAFPSAAGISVQLTASDSNIFLPSSVKIPIGSYRTDVPFQIGAAFNSARVFAIQAQLGEETHTAYGTQANRSQSLGFVAALYASSFVVLASQTTPDYGLLIASIGGYSTEIQLSCEGLPVGASCQFGNNPLDLSAGDTSVSALTVVTPHGLALASYPFTLVLSDGTATQRIRALFSIGDFAVAAPTNQSILSTGFNQLSITVSSINNFNTPIAISCNSGLPPGLTCPWEGALLYPVGIYPNYVQTQNVPVGTYQWTITGTVGKVTHSSTVPLYVTLNRPLVTGSINPSSATIAVGASANFTVTLQSQNGTTGPFAFSCTSTSASVSCGFSPSQVSLPANGSTTTTLSVTVTSKPSTAALQRGKRSQRSALLPGLSLSGLLALFAACSQQRGRKTALLRYLRGLLLIVLVTVLVNSFVSCGGGNGSAGTSPPPSPPPTYVTIDVQTTGPGINMPVGSIRIAIPN